jgi:phosphoserine aminotransferase
VEKAQQIAEEGYSLGSYHSIPSFIGKAQKHQTPETPNVLNIYLLAKVSGDMLGKGIDKIRQETEYKAALLYHTLEDLPGFSPFVKTPAQRSKTVIVAECEASSASIIDKLKKSNMVLGGGYGQYKDRHIRIANFPTHSREQVELLADTLQKIS